MRTEQNLDLVDAVVTSLTKANLTNSSDKVLVGSEDSSALVALQNLMPGVKTVYVIPFNEDSSFSVTPTVLQVCHAIVQELGWHPICNSCFLYFFEQP